MFTSNLIPNKNTRELRNKVNPTSKKLQFSRFWTFLCLNKKPSKIGRKTIHHELVHVGQRYLTLGVGILARDSASLVPR